MFKINKTLFYLIQWTWGLSVNLVGGLIYLICKAKGRKCEKFGYSYIQHTKKKKICLFIFMKGDHPNETWTYNTRIHEYGHTWQCLLLGPFYWFVIGLPSAIWCNFFEGYRKKNNKSYYVFYPEKWANYNGQLATGLKMELEKKEEKKEV